jgi:AraC family transcriptional regulator, ethanolamine operon transcriptional activator
MLSTVARFDDFHLYGASAPEWHQRYQQVSRGTMRSSMVEVTLGHTHLFRKALSQRVLQQGCLPPGKICFAVAAPAAAMARMQGREVTAHSLFVLRGGEEFVIHRPAQMELLAVTFDASRFDALVAQQHDAARLRAALGHGLVEVSASGLAALRGALWSWLSAQVRPRPVAGGLPPAAWVEAAIAATVVHALRDGHVPQGRAKGMSSHALVAECHRLTLANVQEPLSIDALCARLRTSRRTLQDSFQKVAGTTPVDYLRSMRLNLVRRSLHGTLPGEVDIGEIATHAGFSQLSHFAHQYRLLFGELPSQTARADRLRRPAAGVQAALPPTG